LVKQIPYEYRRQAMGDVVQTLLDARSRKAEDVLGWNRHTVELGLNEFRTGIRCLSDVSTRGKKKVEVDNPQLLSDIESILEPHSESDSHLRTTLLHSNVTAKAVRDALIENGYSKDDLPAERTFYELLNRQGYRRRTVAKRNVKKKTP
jgi:transposase